MNTNNTSPKNSKDTKSRIMTISRVSFALLGITFVIINMITESEHSIWLVLGLLFINIATLINIRQNNCCLRK